MDRMRSARMAVGLLCLPGALLGAPAVLPPGRAPRAVEARRAVDLPCVWVDRGQARHDHRQCPQDARPGISAPIAFSFQNPNSQPGPWAAST